MATPAIVRNGKDSLRRGLWLTGAGGAGFAVMYGLLEVLRSEPRALISMLTQWGPVFGLAIVVIVFADRRMGELIAINQQNTEAQQRMAEAMQHIAEKDDRQAEEQRRLIQYVGVQMEKVLSRIDQLKCSQCPEEPTRGITT